MNRKTFNGLLVVGAVIGVFVWAILVNVVMDVTGIPQATQESISFGLGMPGGLICGFLAYKFWRNE